MGDSDRSMNPTDSNDPLRPTDHKSDVADESATQTRPFASSPGTGTFGPGGTDQVTDIVAGRDPQIPAVPGYDILSVLGRGGMGVVYKARHLALKRTVALKMVLAGGHAGPLELARFRTEAEAVARLQHPNIVQIHEVGDAGGHPYCALEFVAGGSLAGKLAGQPLPAREAARLVEALARAVQLAHSRNVIHRDLKPANVLLASPGRESGELIPKISDFGLARQLDSDSGATQAGAVMGTPSYMAPEQASGRSHDAGPAADIYALGAILYECLSGRPPFVAQTVVETLDQVRTQEPPRLPGSVPLDLETICLKCLRKEPEKRYASAAELADELGRYQRGEPIQARPVGRVERAAKWARRNKGLAAALTAAALALLAGTAFSISFGIDAANQAAQARTERKAAEDAREDLAMKNADLERKQDELEGALARNWLSPLALTSQQPLTDAEIEALGQLAHARDQHLSGRFVAEALRDPQGMRRLGVRSEYALHAAVGLNLRKREQVEGMLLKALTADGLPERSQVDAALAVAALGEWTPSTAPTVGQLLASALGREMDAPDREALVRGRLAVVARGEPEERGRVSAAAAASLAQAMTRSTTPLYYHAQGLAAVAVRMDPGPAAETTAILAQAMTKTTNPSALNSLAQGLAAAAARMEPGDGSRVCSAAAATLAEVLTKMADPYARTQLAQGITNVLTMGSPTRQAHKVVAMVAGLSDGRDLPAMLGLLSLAAEPPPCRLSTQQLVDLLKHPRFVGQARRVVLDQLANRYRRTFTDQWEFVRFARQHLPDVNLDSPPKRRTPPDQAVAANGMKR
jgi:hypothetical protein